MTGTRHIYLRITDASLNLYFLIAPLNNISTVIPYMLIKGVSKLAKAFRTAVSVTLDDVIYPNRMTTSEAMRILGLENGFRNNELEDKFRRFYEANSLKNDGSPYIQSKIKLAYDLLHNKRP